MGVETKVMGEEAGEVENEENSICQLPLFPPYQLELSLKYCFKQGKQKKTITQTTRAPQYNMNGKINGEQLTLFEIQKVYKQYPLFTKQQTKK
jgi:hypothetical protein